ncbi:hypothetical protein QAD02_014305 [Eretmocerus hayati]|uniref:Uncharacterized protein n=1 Tax=Eretmocerus hayati TaxID=131215 RepID=A0ACC2P4W8_9HYME|nr:hypothetical protein QAD02_014305 [Eretmocerus hayati]
MNLDEASQSKKKTGRRRSGSESNAEAISRKDFQSESEDILHELEEIKGVWVVIRCTNSHTFQTNQVPSFPSTLQRKNSMDDSVEVSAFSRHADKEFSASRRELSSRTYISDILSEETSDEKDSTERKTRNRTLKSKKRDEKNEHGSTKLGSSSLRKRSKTDKRNQRSKDMKSSIEIPITEILRRTQEQRTKYEEPSPMSQLTAKTMYVQGTNGFSAIKFSSANARYPRKSIGSVISSTGPRPQKVATYFQKIWNSYGLIIQGLLGGMAMLHFILLESSMADLTDLFDNYSHFSEIYTCLFSFFISLCIMSILDKFDLAHVSRDHFRRIFENHKRSILALPLYITAFSLHQFMAKIDDKLSLYGQNSSSTTNNSFGEQVTWEKMTLSKDALVTLGWMIVSTGDDSNLLLMNLESSNEYTDSESPT